MLLMFKQRVAAEKTAMRGRVKDNNLRRDELKYCNKQKTVEFTKWSIQ